ncbi:hypothetical protein EUGRSUZ_C02927 [Eucalyptus grandis]|uniref:Uncharacterized protein n=2 Tax=Eucalyptus grandis TaxID=71139 RepID=A0ACC3LH17_EUCGR|nr:hypothetical protein EUGRSUZ_C02927 [Eucalyptus grandis]
MYKHLVTLHVLVCCDKLSRRARYRGINSDGLVKTWTCYCGLKNLNVCSPIIICAPVAKRRTQWGLGGSSNDANPIMVSGTEGKKSLHPTRL